MIPPPEHQQFSNDASPDEVRRAYDLARREFAAEDWEPTASGEKRVPLGDLLDELEREERQRDLKAG